MKEKKIICWFSAGITSAVATKLTIEKYGDLVSVYYCETGSEHADAQRFIQDCEKWFGVKINRISSHKYKDVIDVVTKTRFINGAYGARCSMELKKEPAKNLLNLLKNSYDVFQVYGFEFERSQINRAIRHVQQNEGQYYFPLISSKLTKKDCMDIVSKQGIEVPMMYRLGFPNANCVGCVKGQKGYWNLIKEKFPDKFEEMARLERDIGRSCCDYEPADSGKNGKKRYKKSFFLDQLTPDKGRKLKPIVDSCGIICSPEFLNIEDKNVASILSGEVEFDLINFADNLKELK